MSHRPTCVGQREVATVRARRKLHPYTQAVYDFICDYLRRKQMSPTIREIGQGVYLGHTTVWGHLSKLEGMGWIVREPGIPRSIRLGELAPDYQAPAEKVSE